MVAVDEAVPRNDYVKFRMEHLYKYNDLRRGLSLSCNLPPLLAIPSRIPFVRFTLQSGYSVEQVLVSDKSRINKRIETRTNESVAKKVLSID